MFRETAGLLLLLCLFNLRQISGSSVQLKPCPPNNLTLSRLENGKTYFFEKRAELGWHKAKEFCEKRNMHLASPKTLRDLKILHQKAIQLADISPWWLSASDVGQEAGDFKWHDGVPLASNDSLWDKKTPAEPNDFGKGKETCVYTFTYPPANIFDDNCAVKLTFICQVPDSCISDQ